MRTIYASPAFVRLFVMNLAFFTGLNVLSVLPDHMEALGASKALIGVFMNLNSLAMVALVVPLSLHADRLGRRNVEVAGFGLGALCHLGAFLMPHSLGMIFFARMGGSLAFMAGFTLHFVEVLEFMPPGRRASGVAVFGISGLLSTPLGAILGEAILSTGQPGLLFLATTLLWSLVVVLALVHPWHAGTDRSTGVSLFRMARQPGMARLMLLSLWAGGAYAVMASFAANLSRECLGEVRISLFFGASALVGLSFRLFFARLLDRRDRRILLATCLGAYGVSYLLSALLHQTWMLMVMGAFFGLATGMVFPLLTAMFVEKGPDSWRLGLNNLATATNTLGNLVFALLMGRLGDALGTVPMMVITGALTPLVLGTLLPGLGGRPGVPAGDVEPAPQSSRG